MTWHRDPSRLDRAYDAINGWLDRREGRMPTPFPARTEPDRRSRAFEIDYNVVKAGNDGADPNGLRLAWALEVRGEKHFLEVRPHSCKLELTMDCLTLGRAPRPTGQAPYVEYPGSIEGSDLVVVAEWRQRSDEHLCIAVCIDGASIADGRTLDEIRSRRPQPVGRYDSLMWQFPIGLVDDPSGEGVLLMLALLPALIPIWIVNAVLLRRRGLGAWRWPLIMIVSIAAVAMYLAVLAALLLLIRALLVR